MAEPAAGLSAPTINTVCGWYHVHPKFAHAILETFVGGGYDRDIDEIHKLLDRYDAFRIQLEYAFSTNVRARALARQLGEWGVALDAGGKRKSYLDIGSAYCGFLIAFGERGYDVTGVELDERFLRLGKLNLEAQGCRADVRQGDFLSEDVLPGERQFDLITCNDVIEHVADPEACLRKICRLLKPGGAAYVASPNKLSLPNVRSEVHSHRFGMALLDYFRAYQAFTMYTGTTDYEVSDYYEPEWYVHTARAAGAQAEIVYDASSAAYDAPSEIAMLYLAFSDWTRSDANRLDPRLRRQVMLEFAAYSARMFEAYGRSIAENAAAEFSKKWIDPLTRILIRMPR